MVQTYKLSYFDERGICEPIRLMLIDNGIKFEDHRISDDDWDAVKESFIFGAVPCLKDGEHEIVQSGAIFRYLSKKHALAGRTEAETAYVDMFHEQVRDLHRQYAKMVYGDYENGKEEFITKTHPAELTRIENFLKRKNNGEKFVAGETLTYADYALFDELDIGLLLNPQCLDKFPVLNNFYHRFYKRDGLKEYLRKRTEAAGRVNGNGKQ